MKNRNYRAAVVCLVLLCVLLLTAVIVLCVHIHTNYTHTRHQLLTNITDLTNCSFKLELVCFLLVAVLCFDLCLLKTVQFQIKINTNRPGYFTDMVFRKIFTITMSSTN